ncbi:hypothetical protein RRU01S_04_01500 [Agrobacterium rubi TR3 = NBRC 13261]|uniref:HTH cro/C1-type domain-containing protein n=1 Tax=Agrobacterium rubi TR3 = NBRC 13261 TaxID=1368415 RepID=A0A081CRN2_9HYPH|nr:helix-turn-helix transcriptional regulator [Agrobacterium rubi]MBP1876863.1 transcriptional regulator with XRE-family HTH domain [Agrobacterium rubi]MCL6651055.1 hypothetical protein [Agrobacterium rubi]GAK69328.1 hypothetical protein RRU01S_04_01500 [Agrobacterium rubi TR3 = NBRC 13261]
MHQDRYKTYGRSFSEKSLAIKISEKFSSVEQFSSALKVERRRVWDWLEGKRRPGLHALRDVCSVLGCAVDDIAPLIEGYRSPAPLAANGISDARSVAATECHENRQRRAAYFQKGRA